MSVIERLREVSTMEWTDESKIKVDLGTVRKLLAVVGAAEIHAEGPHDGNNLESLRQALAVLKEGKADIVNQD